MQCDVAVPNKSKYLKTEMRYARAVKINLYNFKSSFKEEGFLRTNSKFSFHIPFNKVYII